jgi:hypothetical protein
MSMTSPAVASACRAGRRRFLRASVALGAALVLPRPARAAQVRALQGKVTVNGKPLKMSTPIRPGDRLVTGAGARLVFVVGEDAFLLRQNSRLTLDKSAAGGSAVITGLRILTGALLSAFGKGQRRLVTATATIGIRATAVYIEADREQTYLCVCHGDVEVRDTKGTERRRIISGYHTPAMIYADKRAGKMMGGAEVKNHTDEELIMLESLVGRISPVKLRDQKLREGAAAVREAAPAPAVQQSAPDTVTPPQPPAPPPAAAPASQPAPEPAAAPSPAVELEWRLPPPPPRR